MIFFPDTNFFLQCKHYTEISWEDLTSDKTIEIYITRPVQIEIDRLKSNGNIRRASRARKATTLLREIIQSEDFILHEIVGDKEIIFKFCKNYKKRDLERLEDSSLDLDNSDDEILANIKMFMEESSCVKNICFITYDTNPILTAKDNKIPCEFIPDNWLLPPETDERGKEIQKLKQKLEMLKKKEPNIEFNFSIDLIDFTKKGKKNIEITEYSQDFIEKALNILKEKYPLKEDFSEELEERKEEYRENIIRKYIPPTIEEIKEYKTKKYPDWLSDMKKEFDTYFQWENEENLTKKFKFTIKNSGSRPVENLHLTLRIIEGARFQYFDDEYQKKEYQIKFAIPPTSPEGKIKEIRKEKARISFDELAQKKYLLKSEYQKEIEKSELMDAGLRFSQMESIIKPDFDSIRIAGVFERAHMHREITMTQPKRDRNKFYRKNDSEDSEYERSFECKGFRHQMGIEDFDYYFILHENMSKFVFQIEISGTNLVKPILKTYSAEIKRIPPDDQSILSFISELSE